MNVGAWLRGLGLMQNQVNFPESGLRIDVQPELTEVQLGHD
jgi:hypothetical protein